MLHPLDTTQLIWTWIAGLFLGLLFTGFVSKFLATRRRIAASAAWRKVEGEIIHSEVKVPQAHHSDDESDARPLIRYRYQVDGKNHDGDRFALGVRGPMPRTEAEQIVAQYPQGRRIDVYYDPQHPERSALNPKSKDNLVTDAAFAVVFGALAFVLLGQGLLRGVPYLPSGLPVFSLLLPVAMFAVAALSIVANWLDRKKAHASTSWPTTPGQITAVTIVTEEIEHEDDDGRTRNSTRYRPDLRYSYRVGDRDYVGTTWKWGWTALYGSASAAQAAIKRYPQGSRVTVHYDAAAPDNAVLEVGGRGPLAGLVFGGIWAGAGVLFLAMFIYLPWTQG